MDKSASYTIKTGHVKKTEKPYVVASMHYSDPFTKDVYHVNGFAEDHSASEINFLVRKNSKDIGNITLKDGDTEKFLNEFFDLANDYDFKEDFNKRHAQNFSKELKDFINECDSSMMLNGTLQEGFKDKMRKRAGIKTPNKNIR